MRIATIERIDRSIAVTLTGGAAFEAAADLRTRLESAILRSKALNDFAPKEGVEAPLVDESGAPYIYLAYWKVISPRYATEISFTLDSGTLRARVRTLQSNNRPDLDNRLYVTAGDGEFEDEVKFYSVEGLAKQAVQRSLEHRVSLLQDLGFTVSRPTLKKLVKSAGSLAL
jgi:hypothetical protein